MIDPKNLRLPLYDDASDYTTNSPSYYDYLARISELINELAKKVGFYDEELVKRFKEWDDLIQKFPENVENLLIEWMKDGTLDNIINNNIFNQLNDDIKDVANKLQKLRNEFNSYLDHFIINVDYLEGTDTEIFQQAMEIAHNMGGGIVYAPAREYFMEEEVTVYPNTTLWSVEGATYNRMHKGYLFMNGIRGVKYQKYNGFGNIRFINGTFNGNGHKYIGGRGSNIAFAHCDGLVLENLILTNANSHHIEVNSCKNVLIKNCKILGSIPELEYSEGIQLDLATEGGFPAYGDYDNTPCRDVVIEGCYFGGSKECPTLSRGFGTHASRVGAYFENITFQNNIIENCRDYGIQLLCYKDSVIRNNVIRKTNGGLIAYSNNPENEVHAKDIYNVFNDSGQPCTNILIEGNTFEYVNNKQVMISYGRTKSRNNNFKIINNKIINCTDTIGILSCIFTDNVDIVGNTIQNVDKYGIYVRNCTWSNIEGNKVIGVSKSNAIVGTEKIRYMNIVNNFVSKGAGNGITVYNDVYSIQINGNTIIGCNGLDDGYHGIYLHSTGGKVLINSNLIRPVSGYKYPRAIFVASTIADGIATSNMSDLGTETEKYLLPNLTSANNI